MAKFKFGNGDNLSVPVTDNDTYIIGNGNNDVVSADHTSGDMIIVARSLGDQ